MEDFSVVPVPLRKHNSCQSWSSLLISVSISSSVLGCSSVTGCHYSGRIGTTDIFWPEFSIRKSPAIALHCTQTNVHFQNPVAGQSIRNNFLCYFQMGQGSDWFWPAHAFSVRLEVIIICRTAKAEHHVICCQHLGTLLVVYIN